jgi:hypothetical protein
MNIKDFELLLVKDIGSVYELVGITYSTALLIDSTLTPLKASFLTIQKAKECLKNGDYVTIPKVLKFSEVQPDELIINMQDTLSILKRSTLNEINSRMHQSIIGVSLIDAMNFMNNYLKLLNKGYCITDENREEKYFEIIEQAQSIEEPQELKPNYTFEDEQRYIDEKRNYENAQSTLTILENYLNAYDNLSKIQNVCNILNESKEKIESATNEDEILVIKEEYLKEINKFNE